MRCMRAGPTLRHQAAAVPPGVSVQPWNQHAQCRGCCIRRCGGLDKRSGVTADRAGRRWRVQRAAEAWDILQRIIAKPLGPQLPAGAPGDAARPRPTPRTGPPFAPFTAAAHGCIARGHRSIQGLCPCPPSLSRACRASHVQPCTLPHARYVWRSQRCRGASLDLPVCTLEPPGPPWCSQTAHD
jgi:hypothetical protein